MPSDLGATISWAEVIIDEQQFDPCAALCLLSDLPVGTYLNGPSDVCIPMTFLYEAIFSKDCRILIVAKFAFTRFILELKSSISSSISKYEMQVSVAA